MINRKNRGKAKLLCRDVRYIAFWLSVKRFFLLADDKRRRKTAKREHHQSDPKSHMAVVAGLRRGRILCFKNSERRIDLAVIKENGNGVLADRELL